MHVPAARARHVHLALLVASLSACTSESGPPELPWVNLAVPAVVDPADNPTTPAKVELGRMLFHDPILSSDRAVACVTCHGEIWGLSDGLEFSIGVGGVGPAGTGRTGPTHTQRNSQTVWNTAYRTVLFWDGRAASLEDQVDGPLNNPVELGRTADEVAVDLATFGGYVTLFQAAFPGDAQPITAANLRRALAAFERTLVSTASPYDQYAAGDRRALAADAVRGMFLLQDAGCTSCHEPPLFASDRFETAGVAPVAGVPDDGRFEVTGDPADHGKYRVPTLRNIRETAPYMHTGTIWTLADAVRSHGANRVLTQGEIDDLVAFLRDGLIDTTRSPERATTVPSGLPVPLDGYEVPRP